MRNPFRLWLRLLGLTGEPESFALPDPPEVVRERLLSARRRDGLDVRPWRDAVRVLVPVDVPWLPDRPLATVRVTAAGGGSRVDVTYGLRFWVHLAAYVLPIFTLACAAAVAEAVTSGVGGRWWRGVLPALAYVSVVHSLVSSRRGMRRLRERVPAMVRS